MRLNVFLTIDTELRPWTRALQRDVSPELERYIHGVTRRGNFGLGFQMDTLNRHGLRAVFFVESLFACAVGLDPLRSIVRLVQAGGHEVQLHVHSEWLEAMESSILPGKTGYNLKDFSQEEQLLLVQHGVRNLHECGVKTVSAFRAGNYGANWDTLSALAQSGILYDTSYNVCYLHSDCGLQGNRPLLQPTKIGGVCEFPISFFEDWPGHYRHAQLCACSSAELEAAMLEAWKRQWHSFVVVLHSFELLRRPLPADGPGYPDEMVVRRFHRLCRFLANHRDKFHTALFSEIVPQEIPDVPKGRPLRGRLHRTVLRCAEQLVRRISP